MAGNSRSMEGWSSPRSLLGSTLATRLTGYPVFVRNGLIFVDFLANLPLSKNAPSVPASARRGEVHGRARYSTT
jgi:hypothetical protein